MCGVILAASMVMKISRLRIIRTSSIMDHCNPYGPGDQDKMVRVFSYLWLRRLQAVFSAECSVKSSEGFRLHKGVIRLAYSVPTVTECERMCWSEDKFQCVTYSYRYSPVSRDNCLLCDRPINLLDFYADIEPDRDYDIYAMTDDVKMCSKQIPNERDNNARKIPLNFINCLFTYRGFFF